MFDSSLAYRGFLRIERTTTAALETPMTYTTLQYEGNPQCRACGRTHWSRNSACCECDTACCDLCAAVLPNDELVCFRCQRDYDDGIGGDVDPIDECPSLLHRNRRWPA